MVIEDTIIAQPPNVFTESEIQDLLAMVRAGEEVGRVVLEQNARNAQCLVFARKGSCLVGVAALKNPQASYRQTIKTKARVAVEAQDFPFELGYIFVRPTARLQGLAKRLYLAALASANGKGVFATTRTTNDGMNALLPMLSFTKTGNSYGSVRDGHQLQLFVRRAAQPSDTADAPRAARR